MEEIEGLSLLVSKYKDNDGVINVLTPNSIVPILGRGIFKYSSKNFICSNSFIYGKFEIYKGPVGNFKLKSFYQIKNFTSLSSNYNYLVILNLISEIILKTEEGITDSYNICLEKVLSLLESFNESNDECLFNTSIFLLDYLKLLGIKPEFNVFKGKYFDLKEGQFINTKNKSTIKLTSIDLNFLENYQNANFKKDSTINYYKIIALIVYFLEYQFNIELKSLDLLLIS